MRRLSNEDGPAQQMSLRGPKGIRSSVAWRLCSLRPASSAALSISASAAATRQAMPAITINGVIHASTPAPLASGSVLEVPSNLRTGDSGDSVGQEYPGVIRADVLVSEEVGRCRREQGKVSAKVEPDDTGTDGQTRHGAAHFEEHQHHDALNQAHEEQRGFPADLVRDGTPQRCGRARSESHTMPLPYRPPRQRHRRSCWTPSASTAKEPNAVDHHQSSQGRSREHQQQAPILRRTKIISPARQINRAPVALAALAVLASGGFQPSRLPAGGRVNHHDAAKQHKHQEDDAVNNEHALHAGQIRRRWSCSTIHRTNCRRA